MRRRLQAAFDAPLPEQEEITHRTQSRVVSQDATVTLRSLCESESAVLHARVRLQQVTLLSIGKVSESSKGKGASGHKGKPGKNKGGVKGKNKQAQPSAPQQSVVVYFGDNEGYIMCTLASADAVKRVPNAASRLAEVDVSMLSPIPGRPGVLRWTVDTVVSFRMQASHNAAPKTFPYATSCVSANFATYAHAQEANLGE